MCISTVDHECFLQLLGELQLRQKLFFLRGALLAAAAAAKIVESTLPYRDHFGVFGKRFQVD